MPNPAISSNSVAVITGGASGIGLATAMRFARLGLRICIADLGSDRLSNAASLLSKAAPDGSASIMTHETDVSRISDIRSLSGAVGDRFGGTDILMNNAGIQPGSDMFGPAENWERVLNVNLWGVIYGTQIFVPGMIERGRPGLVINTGSKQGITTPPGDPAYNVSKAGVKVFTEALAHELRNKLEKPPPVVHYDDGIYQFGVRVGSVKGARLDPVRKLLEFAALEFQGKFIAGDDFEYRDYVLKIISSESGVQTMMTDNNSGVLQNVICRIVSGLN